MKPLLRWVGGKKWLSRFLGELPSCRTYHEPFFGSGKLYFSEIKSESAVINDCNTRLMHTYAMVRDFPGELAHRLERTPTDRDFYLGFRTAYDKLDSIDRAVWMFVVNCLGFNGLYRVNAKGDCNVPYGKPPKPYPSREHLLQVSAYMRETVPTQIVNEDFSLALRKVGQGDLVFMDPPYLGKFTGYQAQSWTPSSAQRVADEAKRCAQKGAGVIVTLPNDQTHLKLMQETGLTLHEAIVPGHVSCYAGRRADMLEGVWTNLALETQQNEKAS